jgi:hypothetical protein
MPEGGPGTGHGVVGPPFDAVGVPRQFQATQNDTPVY